MLLFRNPMHLGSSNVRARQLCFADARASSHRSLLLFGFSKSSVDNTEPAEPLELLLPGFGISVKAIAIGG